MVLQEPDAQLIGPALAALGLEIVLLEQVRDGDLALVLLLRARRRQRDFVDDDRVQALAGIGVRSLICVPLIFLQPFKKAVAMPVDAH